MAKKESEVKTMNVPEGEEQRTEGTVLSHGYNS